MSSTYGENLHLTIFGQSHSPAIGVTVEGIPAGEKVDLDELQRFLNRRAPGKNVWSTPRKEADAPEILSGLVNGYTCGAPLTAIIRNTNTRSQDYANLAVTPRPGHADYTAEVKYGGYQDRAGGGHFSGRLTAPLCIAGGICLQILAREGITVVSRIASIAGITDEGELTGSLAGKEFPVVSDARGEEMREAIAAAPKVAAMMARELGHDQAWIDTQHRVSWTAPQGVSTSFIQLDIPEDDEDFCKRLLAERGVLLVPGSRFELPCGARLGYCASEDVLREGLRLLGEALAEFDR